MIISAHFKNPLKNDLGANLSQVNFAIEDTYKDRVYATDLRAIDHIYSKDVWLHQSNNMLRLSAALKVAFIATAVFVGASFFVSSLSLSFASIPYYFSLLLVYPKMRDLFNRSLFLDLGPLSAFDLKYLQIVAWPILTPICSILETKNAITEFIYADKSQTIMDARQGMVKKYDEAIVVYDKILKKETSKELYKQNRDLIEKLNKAMELIKKRQASLKKTD